MLCTAIPDISISSKNINSTARVSKLSLFLMTVLSGIPSNSNNPSDTNNYMINWEIVSKLFQPNNPVFFVFVILYCYSR